MKNTGQSPTQSFKKLIGVHPPPVNLANIKSSYTAFKNLFKLNIQQYRLLGEHIPEGLWIINGNGQTVYTNSNMIAMLGYALPEMDRLSLVDCLDKNNLNLLNAYIQSNPGYQVISLQKQLTFLKKDHSPLWTMVSVNHVFGITKKLNHIIMIVSDVSHSKPAEHRLSILNQMYSVLCHTHRAIIQLRGVRELCREICQILVNDGLFKMVSIGRVNFEMNHTDWVAHYESDSELPAPIYFPDLDNQDPYNREIIATIRAGNIAVVNDIENIPAKLPWRADVLQRGCRSFIILPIKVFDEIIYSISICAGDKGYFNEEEQELLKDLTADLSYAIESIQQEEQRENTQKALKDSEDRLQDSDRHLNKVMIEIVKSFATTIETRDPYTAGHQDRVSKLAHAIAQEMGLPAAQIDAIILAATIHDIGKLFVPSEILNKPGKISENEYKLIKTHPQIGYDIIKEIEFTWPIADIILQHHERLDGSGYPNKMAGDFILLEAKIIGVADVVEAMASHRPYRPALGVDKALEEISRNQGVLYDPVVVEVCIDLLNKVEFQFG